jgi:hypothetical protein
MLVPAVGDIVTTSQDPVSKDGPYAHASILKVIKRAFFKTNGDALLLPAYFNDGMPLPTIALAAAAASDIRLFAYHFADAMSRSNVSSTNGRTVCINRATSTRSSINAGTTRISGAFRSSKRPSRTSSSICKRTCSAMLGMSCGYFGSANCLRLFATRPRRLGSLTSSQPSSTMRTFRQSRPRGPRVRWVRATHRRVPAYGRALIVPRTKCS